MIKAVIIDDEKRSRESLQILIQDFCKNVDIAAVCADAESGISAIDKVSPDIVFLDIQLQRETGFDLLSKIGRIDFEVIFTTAYSEYAIQAIKFSPVDYLLKPIDIGDLQDAVERVSKKILVRDEENVSRNNQQFRQLEKLAVPTLDGLALIKLSDIIYLESSSNYTTLFLSHDRKHVVAKTLKDYEEMLLDQNFFRIHNCYLVNLTHVEKYIRGEGGQVVMSNGSALDVSKRRKHQFLSRIG